jgi:hypothetical protein
VGLDYNDLNFTQPGRKQGTPKYPIERRKATIGRLQSKTMTYSLRKIRGLAHKFFCKHILHKYDVMTNGVSIFTDYADIYGDSIYDTYGGS